jgi:hypothetical protein
MCLTTTSASPASLERCTRSVSPFPNGFEWGQHASGRRDEHLGEGSTGAPAAPAPLELLTSSSHGGAHRLSSWSNPLEKPPKHLRRLTITLRGLPLALRTCSAYPDRSTQRFGAPPAPLRRRPRALDESSREPGGALLPFHGRTRDLEPFSSCSKSVSILSERSPRPLRPPPRCSVGRTGLPTRRSAVSPASLAIPSAAGSNQRGRSHLCALIGALRARDRVSDRPTGSSVRRRRHSRRLRALRETHRRPRATARELRAGRS